MRLHHLALALLPLFAAGCYATTTSSRTWGGPAPQPLPERYGRVEWIRETVHQQQGNPAGGAVVGAIIGGLLGNAVTGHSGGTLVGAVGGAAVGASASQGSSESRSWQMGVRFDDGELRVFALGGYSAFRVGDAVAWNSRGLYRRGPAPAGAPSPTPYGAPAYPPPVYPAPAYPPPAYPPPTYGPPPDGPPAYTPPPPYPAPVDPAPQQ